MLTRGSAPRRGKFLGVLRLVAIGLTVPAAGEVGPSAEETYPFEAEVRPLLVRPA
jgi:hypothetical protein